MTADKDSTDLQKAPDCKCGHPWWDHLDWGTKACVHCGCKLYRAPDVSQQPDARLVETYEVHQKHCQVCGDGEECATGEALKEDAYPQNDSVNENQSNAPLSCPFCGSTPDPKGCGWFRIRHHELCWIARMFRQEHAIHSVGHEAWNDRASADQAVVDECQRRMDAVVDAAVEWHQTGQEGDNTWPEKAEALSQAIDQLLEMRSQPATHADSVSPSVAEALAMTKRWKAAIEGLTPNGSEFVDDPEACARYIRERCRYPKQIIDLRAERDSLRAENEKLQARLARLAKYEQAANFGDAMFGEKNSG